MLLTICDCLMLKETKEMRRGKLCPTFSGQNTPSQFIFHVSLLSLIWLYKNGPGAHFCDMISNRGLCFSAQGAYTAFSFSGGIFYLYFINFDHTENFMSTRLNVISINFVKPQSGPDMSLTYISSMCGNLVEVGIAAMYSPCRKGKKNEWKCMKSLTQVDQQCLGRHHEKGESMTSATLLFCHLPTKT